MQRFYVTKKSIFFSSLILLVAFLLTLLCLFKASYDPYTHLYEEVKQSALDSLGIEISADKTQGVPLFHSLSFENVSLKFKDKDEPFFKADKLSLEMPFFNLFFIFTSLDVPLSVRVNNAHIIMNENSIDNSEMADDKGIVEVQSAKPKQKTNMLSRILERTISLNLDDFSIDINTGNLNVSANNLFADVSFDKNFNFKNFSLTIPSLLFQDGANTEFGLNGGSASINDGDRINFWFDNTYIKTNKNDISVNINNFSPYIGKNNNGNQTLYIPLSDFTLSSVGGSFSSPSSMIEVEMLAWNDINVSAKIDKADYSGDVGDVTITNFGLNYSTKTNQNALTSYARVNVKPNRNVVPFSFSFNASFLSLTPFANGNIALNDITFENLDEKFSIFSTISNNKAEIQATSFTSYNEAKTFDLNASYDFSTRFLELNMTLSHLSSDVLKISSNFPSWVLLSPSFVDGKLSLKSNAEVRDVKKFEAFGNAAFILSNLQLLSFKSDAKLDALIHVENNKISIPNASVSLFDTVLSFSGEQRFDETFPTFKADVKRNNKVLVSIALNNSNTKREKILSVLTSDKNIGLSSRLGENQNGDWLFSGEVKAYSYSYPFSLGLNIKDKVLSLVNPALKIYGSYKKGSSIRIEVDNLETPRLARLKLKGAVVSTNAVLRFIDNSFSLDVNNFNLDVQDALNLSFRGKADAMHINVNNIHIKTRNNTYVGAFNIDAKNGVWDFKNVTFGMALENQSKLSYVYLSYLSSDESVSFLANIKDLHDINSVLPIPFDTASLMVLFESNLKDKHSAYGNVNFSQIKGNGNEFSFNFAYDDNIVNVSDLKLSLDNMLCLDKTNASLDLQNGALSLSSSLLYLHPQSDEPNPFSFDFALDSNIKRLLDIKLNFQKLDSLIETKVKLSNANFDNAFYPPNINGNLSFDKTNIKFMSDIIKGTYDFGTSYFTLNIDKSFSFGLDAKGTIKKELMDVTVKNIYFPFHFFDSLVWSDAVGFVDGVFEGEARFYGPLLSPEIFGFLEAPKATMWYLWAEKETCVIVNPLINFYGTTMNIPKTEVYSQHKDTGRISHFYASAEFTIRSWDLPYMNVVLDIDKNNPVSVSVPLPVPNIEIEVDEVWGHCEIGLHHLVYPDIKFDLTAKNGILSQPARYPKWMYDPTVSTSSSVSLGSEYTKLHGLIKVEQGAKFMFPSKTSPIINATLSENQSAELVYENDKFYLNGDLDIKGGDIFYFQKNFLITEGTLSWHKMDLGDELFSSSDFAGINLNLVARLKDFDLNGDPTDIYLTLSNATIDNIAPHLSSSTGLSDAEILSVLGQNLLPASTYTNSGISSLVYLSSVAVDVASRVVSFPRLTQSTFDSTVERALGLDMFSIRQRIFYNLLVDVIPEKGRNYPDNAFARYLNGTTVFLGKNISENWFFQTTLSLFSSDNYTKSKKLDNFFIQGLKGDLEFALEWNNELASISLFSSPNELSFFGILDNIGISIKKHFLL